jgi:hypothetical protein
LFRINNNGIRLQDTEIATRFDILIDAIENRGFARKGLKRLDKVAQTKGSEMLRDSLLFLPLPIDLQPRTARAANRRLIAARTESGA